MRKMLPKIIPITEDILNSCIVTNDGKVFSLENRLLSKSKSRGYESVRIKGVYYSVHRLVATKYIPNEMNLPYVNHKNGIKNDNRIENLEWCTQSQNMKHAYATGLKKPKNQKRANNSNAKLSETDVEYIQKCMKNKIKDSFELAKQFSIHRMHVYKVCNGRRWK